MICVLEVYWLSEIYQSEDAPAFGFTAYFSLAVYRPEFMLNCISLRMSSNIE